MTCSTFLLKLLDENEPADETETGDYNEVQDKVMTAPNAKLYSKKGDLAKHLKAFGGREQLLMFLTGPAGAGKSTAVQAAKVCQQCYKVQVFIGWTLPMCIWSTQDLQLLPLVA